MYLYIIQTHLTFIDFIVHITYIQTRKQNPLNLLNTYMRTYNNRRFHYTATHE
jgi:hypothetical protein